MFRVLLLPLLWLATDSEARVFQRCVDATGHLTYTYTLCPPGSEGIDHRAWNPPPGSIAPPTRRPAPRLVARPVVVVGERERASVKPTTTAKPRKKAKPAKYLPAKAARLAS